MSPAQSAPPAVTLAPQARRSPRLRVARDLVVDSVALGGACTVAAVTMPSGDPSPSAVALVGFSLATLALLAMRGMYAPHVWSSYLDDLRALVVSTTIAAMGMASLSLLFSGNVDAADQSLRVWLFAAAYLAAARGATRIAALGLRRRPGVGRPTLIVGEPETAALLAQRLLDEPGLGLRPLALLQAPSNDGELEAVIREHRIGHAVVCAPSPFEDGTRELVHRFEELGVAVWMLPEQFDGVPDRIVVERPAGLPLMRGVRSDPPNWALATKYALDRILAALLLVCLAPILLLAALAVIFESGRPIFFRQRRVGQRGVEFDMLKFRTLTGSPDDHGEADADWAEQELAGEIRDSNEVGPRSRRETRVGHVLRTTGVDELPQLINVLLGEMSIIGPRPERESYVRRFEPHIPRYADRHRVKPGITGWAQVNGFRGKSPLAQRVQLDNYYIENWSFWLDVKILLLTVIAVFRGSPQQCAP